MFGGFGRINLQMTFTLRRAQLRRSSKLHCIKIGTCYYGIPKPYAERLVREGHHSPPNRAFTSWQRPETPELGCIRAVEIWLPPGPLYDRPAEAANKKILVLDPPPDGQAVLITLEFYRGAEAKFIPPAGAEMLGCFLLSSGERLVVLAGTVNFDYVAFKAQLQPMIRASFPNAGHLLTTEEQIVASKQLRITLNNDPKVDGILMLFDCPATISRAT